MLSVWESLHFATLELVRSSPIKQRLVGAYRHLVTLRSDSLPAEVRESYSHVMSTLQCVQPVRGEECVVASVRKLAIQEADDCAALIVEIYGVACRAVVNATRPGAAVQSHGVEQLVAHT